MSQVVLKCYLNDNLLLGPILIENNLICCCFKLNFLLSRNLDGIKYQQLSFEAIKQLPSLKFIIYQKYYFCSLTPHVKNCRPITDGKFNCAHKQDKSN